ncbi:hypothetical protein [Marinobacter bohaiensis]|uniref:hypothetical protein n=1 Tax=Marinobacter bohaiensis TaxID=2201898 RepID=UPI000DABE07E|nr:hypothetical protein [Marinobacter bohaiensis]
MPVSPETAQQIAQLMGRATENVLWQPARDWVRQRSRKSELTCRAGRGQATYHRFDPANGEHLITYGQRMVAAKFEAHSSQGWLSTREIQRRGYFDGEVSTANLLAHTCCHEFAHLLQSISGGRRHGSVHNAAFYKILDELHASGGARAVRHHLVDQCEGRGIVLPREGMDLVAAEADSRRFAVGDDVRFGHEERPREGRVIRVNRRTCTVQGTGRWRGARYRVPLSMLTHR